MTFKQTGRLVAPAAAFVAAIVLLGIGWSATIAGQERSEGFRFRSAVDLVNVTVTVSDRSGRFVTGLRQEDFTILEDGEPQSVSHFDNQRVPVSLGLVVDSSGSMAGEKMASAKRALDRLFSALLDPDDELFLYRFGDTPDLVESWTSDRSLLRRAVNRMSPKGGTAMYDAMAEAVPLAESGQHQKKALLLISDGNDTNSATSVRALRQRVRESEVMVYAIGIDGRSVQTWNRGTGIPRGPTRPPFPIPFPVPGRRQPPNWPGRPAQPGPQGGGMIYGRDDRVNVAALRELSDDSGGRTEIVRDASDIEPATASIADELSRQYYLGYTSTRPQDGKWHSIEVRVDDASYRVRARRGYIATP